MRRYASTLHILALAAAIVGSTACGGGGGSSIATTADAPQQRTAETRWSNGQLKEQGPVIALPEGDVRHGTWKRWFEDGALQWQGTYERGSVDPAKPWREWNIDGSVRDDWRDAADDASDASG